MAGVGSVVPSPLTKFRQHAKLHGGALWLPPWVQIDDIPKLTTSNVADYNRSNNGVALGPYSAAVWEGRAYNKPGPYDGIVAVDPNNGELLAVWDRHRLGRTAKGPEKPRWTSMTTWNEVRNGFNSYVSDLDATLSDGIYVCVLPDDLDPRKVNAPAFLFQKDGVQELWQSYYGPRRFRRSLTD